jgi:hypothetical protein
MTISFSSNTGFNDPTLSYSDEVSEEVAHVDAEVTVRLTVLVPITFTRQQVAARVNDALLPRLVRAGAAATSDLSKHLDRITGPLHRPIGGIRILATLTWAKA